LHYLDLSIAVTREVRIRVLENPGRWMAPTEFAPLLDSMREVTRRGIGEDLHYGVLSGDPQRLRNAIITLLHDRATGQLVAFNALSYLPLELRGRETQAVHLGLVMVDPGYRAKGLSWVLYGLTSMLIFVRRGLRPLWMSNVTQVPAIIGKVSESFPNAFPNPFHASRRSFDHLCVAREIMRKHRGVFGVGPEAGFDEERFIITNAYTGGSDNLKKSFAVAPKHRDARANALCEQQLDYARGDDFLQIARLDQAGALRYLLRDVPRHSLPGLLYRLLFLLLGRIFMPLLYWLSPGVPMGDLRART
jgi:GNAT superfamily N-acetyltransferase